MDNYTIYCTEEQKKKALKLGAPIETYEPTIIHSRAGGSFTTPTIETVTAEELIGWLEEQGLYFSIECIGDYVYEVWTKDKDKSVIIINSCVHTRKEATLAAIDAALDYLKKNKK